MNQKSSLSTYLFSGVGVAVMFLLLVAVYVISGVVKHRVDLTADRIYTLSDGTHKILDKLDTPVEVRFYCSQRVNSMPVFLKTYAQRIEDLLTEYRKYSKGKLTIKKFDPEPDSDAEDSANLDGIEGQPLQTGEKIYLGLAVSCLDSKVALPFLTPDREKLLEYDLSRAISRVITIDKPVVGVMTALPMFGMMNPMMMQMGGGRQDPWVVINELKQDYTVKQVEMTADKIDDDIKVLIVVYPKDITDKAQYAIDQFVLRGGKLVAFLDPLYYLDQSGGPQMNPMQRNINSGASLDKLLKAWGIEFDKNKVVADLRFITRVGQTGTPMPAVLSLTQEGVDTNDVTTSQLDNLMIPFAGVFTGTPAEGLKETVLLKTTSDSQMVEKMMAQFSGEQTSKDFSASGKAQALAIRLAGKFKTAFPDGKPKDADPKDASKEDKQEDKNDAPGLKESKTDGVVVLVGDVDAINDQVCVSIQQFFGQKIVMQRNQNLNFVQNVVDQLGGDSDLIGVRSRASMSRPFTLVKKMQAAAEDRYRSKIKDLEKKLSDTQQKLNEMQSKKEGNQRYILSPEQQQEIADFRKQEATVKQELKKERKGLRQDIESLETRLEWINIAGMPLLVTGAGLGLALIKRKKTAAK